MNHWVVVWKTWLEADIETPWPFILLQHTNEFKNRETGAPVPSDRLDTVYLSFDAEQVVEFETDNVSAVLLSAVIDAETDQSAADSVKSIFFDSEIVQVIAIPEHAVEQIRTAFMEPGATNIAPG